MKLQATRHAKYNINYHFVWIPKYRRKILKGDIVSALERILQETASNNGVNILSLSIQEDHIHLFVSAPPRLSPALLVNIFKGTSAKLLLRQFPKLKAGRSSGVWTRSYYVGTAGTVSEETIRYYIEQSQEDD
jgi:putative transposase